MTSDSGMAVSVMNVVRKLSRNRNRMISTSTAPITSASPTLKMPRSMKFLQLEQVRVDDDVGRQRRLGLAQAPR